MAKVKKWADEVFNNPTDENFAELEKYHGSPNILYTNAGNITEITRMDFRNQAQTIERIDKDFYRVMSDESGEIHEFTHSENRGQNADSLKKTLRRLRLLINNNFYGASNELMLTLTYRQNMRDSRKLQEDFERFIRRLRKQYPEHDLQYLAVIEPQERGAWHLHILLKGCKRLFIPNKVIAECWAQGFTKTKAFADVDNIGAYLTAYLANLPTDDKTSGKNVITKEVNGKRKKFIKGARLHLYPTGINIYRHSRGIKMPQTVEMPYLKALDLVKGHVKTLEYDVKIEKDNFINNVHKEYYNSKRRPNDDK